MEQDFRLDQYITKGVEDIVRSALKATLSDPKQSAFMIRYAASAKKASKIREQFAAQGEHIPPFLITSITSICNLHCAGCYARANDACHDGDAPGQLSAAEWNTVFREAKDLGIGFILLAGGEPLIRRDVIEAAGDNPEILFPIFTNGTMLKGDYLQLFDKHRNLLPILSIEGDRQLTDARRGEGIFDQLIDVMNQLSDRGLMFGASVTVTKENMRQIVSEEFLSILRNRGCKVVFYVEYVPVVEDTAELAPGDTERSWLTHTLNRIRRNNDSMLMISFPGDEQESGGCLAAGRGFIHINAYGGAEPCPFSPYSDSNVKNGLLHAMHSRLFTILREGEMLRENHDGGCVLFSQHEKVEALLGVPVL